MYTTSRFVIKPELDSIGSAKGNQPSRPDTVLTLSLDAAKIRRKQSQRKFLNKTIDMATFEEQIQQLPIMDATRVVAVHNKIINGDFKVLSALLAEKIMAFEDQL